MVTDRQTDGRTDRRLTVASPRSVLASRGKNRRTFMEVIAKNKTGVPLLLDHSV